MVADPEYVNDFDALSAASASFACHFAHENSNEAQPPLCPEDVRNNRLGCPHGAAILRIRHAIKDFLRRGLLSQGVAVHLKTRLEESERDLLQYDGLANQEYAYLGLSPETKAAQSKAIATRVAIMRLLRSLNAKPFAVPYETSTHQVKNEHAFSYTTVPESAAYEPLAV